jgi:hypothetical protein
MMVAGQTVPLNVTRGALLQALDVGELNCCRHSNNARKRWEEGHVIGENFRRGFTRINADLRKSAFIRGYLISFPSSRQVRSWILFS